MRIELAAIAACCSFACADAASPAEATSFADVVSQAQTRAPRLRELDADVLAAEGRARQSRAWPMPALGIEREDFAGSGAFRGSARAQTTLSLSEPIEIGGQRRARIDAGRAGIAAAEARRAQLRAQLGYDLAVAYAEAEVAQGKIALLSDDLERAREDLRSARALVDAGREGELRAVQSEAAASAAEADLEAARADVVAALARLSSLVGEPEPYARVAPSLLDRSSSVATVPDEPQDAPIVVTAQAEREHAQQLVRVEEKRALPVPAFSIGRRHLAADDADVWVAGFSIPLPITDRNRGNIAAARAELRAADARLDAARAETDASRRAAQAQATAASSRLRASQQGEASAREAYRLARIGYDAGRTPLFELLGTRRALTDAQLRSLDARLARVQAEAALAELEGRIPFIE